MRKGERELVNGLVEAWYREGPQLTMGSMQGRGVDSKIVGDQVKTTSSGEVAVEGL